jgi:hypothetical protein
MQIVNSDIDDRPKVQLLFKNLKKELPRLRKLQKACHSHSGYEDSVYRFYHQSFKVYRLQGMTEQILSALGNLLPDTELNSYFTIIIEEGTGKEFEKENNTRWFKVTRPIVEAFFHAQYFLEMAVKYGKKLKYPPNCLPSGWASLLYLYNLR